MSHEKHDSALADAIWWLIGFRAAHEGSDGSDPTRGLGDDLRGVREWINGLALGRTRLIGTDERKQGVALTEYEFEVLFDGLREGATVVDVDLARAAIKKVLDELRAERSAMLRGEVVF